MSNERRYPDDVTDTVVSNAYRDLSNERAPEHLDHVVLNKARDAAKQRHRSAMAWLRPTAWVATIGLCLAIVLEVADLPLQQQGVFDEAVKDEKEAVPEPAAEELPASAPVEAKSSDDSAVDNVTVPQRSMPRQVEPARTEAGPADAKSGAMTPAETLERQAVGDDAPAAIEVDMDAERQFLREAEERARLQAGSDEKVEGFAVQIQGAASPGIASEMRAERYCDDEQTRDPNTWLECIVDLENRGMLEAAMLERELLQAAFPEQFVPAEMMPPPRGTDD